MILAEEWGNNLLVYLYDASGSPIGMCYRLKTYEEGKWDTYFFEKNLQGDIVAVFAVSGIRLATYVYDAWGNCTTSYFNGGATTAAQYNPFRYRSYYLDTETGFYYLQSRYYDPNTCRFINADSYVSTGQGLTGYNMFAYCGNNPVNYVDYTGESALGVVILLLLGAGALVVLTSCENPDVNNLKDTYGNVGDVIGFVDDSVQFGEDLQVYKSYEYSYSFAVSHYYQTNELYWDKHLEEAFSGDEERCLYLIEGDINLLKYNKNNKEHFNNINNVDYLYNHFDEWALYGRTGIVKQSAGNPLQSGTKWYEDIWGFVAGMFN